MMVGTDDGYRWWSLTGFCTSPKEGTPMSLIHFDFRSKGGPKDLVGVWAKGSDGKVTLTWPDGNVWKLVKPTYDSDLVSTHGARAALQSEAPAPTVSPAGAIIIILAVTGLVVLSILQVRSTDIMPEPSSPRRSSASQRRSSSPCRSLTLPSEDTA